MVEIAVVLCSVFLVAILAIAAEQTTQEMSASTITTASEDDYVLGIYGNANEDDTIDMRDVTYTKLVIFGKKTETELADAYYDSEVDVLDVVQVKLIILGRESELTVVQYLGTPPDITEETVTVPMPIERIVALSSYACEALCIFDVEDKIVGVGESVKETGEIVELIEDKEEVGSCLGPDVEKIISLEPDLVITYAILSWCEVWREQLNSAGIPVMLTDFYKPDKYDEEFRVLGWLLHNEERAEELINFEQQHKNLIKERVQDLKPEEKIRVYYCGSPYYYSVPTHTAGEGASSHAVIELCGGINIFADLKGWVTVDPEEVIIRNPQVIYATTHAGTTAPLGYGITDTGPVEECRQDIIMDYPGWDTTDAVKNARVYFISTDAKSVHPSVYLSYLAKWFYPELFEDVDPVAIHREWLETFLGVEYQGVYAYPTYPV